MTILCISDNHNKHKLLKSLPEADIIVHCGDISSVGKEHEVRNFLKWYSNLNQYTHKIFIAGNHDWLFERNRRLAINLIPKNIIYLEDNGVEIEDIKFWGSPVSKPFYNWAFNRPEEKLMLHYNMIPDYTDVLITHNPPYSIMDLVEGNNEHYGSPSLYYEVLNRIKPKISIFGHIHEGYGIKVIDDITFINASNLDGEYQCINPPILVEIINGIVNVI
jgi:Icc-related predicted phosphoesterase